MPADGCAAAPPATYNALTRQEQHEALDITAKLVNRLAVDIAARLRAYAPGRALWDADDIRVEGQLATLDARMSFDPTRGASLKTHLYNLVRWRMLDFCRRAKSVLREERGTVSVYAALEMQGDGAREERESAPRFAVLSADPTPEDHVADQDAREWVARTVGSVCTPREAIVVLQRLAGEDGTDAELAQTFGVDRSRVCVAKASAVTKLARVAYAPRRGGVAACG